MVDALRKLLLAGLGTLDLTEEKARSVFNDLVARGEMSEKEARDLFAGWSKRATEERGRLQQEIESTVARAMSAMGLAYRSEVDSLSARVAELERTLERERAKTEEPGPPAEPTKTS